MDKNILENLNWRYATKIFDKNKKLSTEELLALKESLRLSPSSFGLQAWKFVIVNDHSLREKLVPHSYNQAQVVEASHLFVLCRPAQFEEKYINHYLEDLCEQRSLSRESISGLEKMLKGFVSQMNATDSAQWMNRQVYLALGVLLTTAAALNVDACPIEGFVPQKYDEILGLKERGLTSVVVCPVGFRSADDKYAQLRKVRFPAKEIFLEI